MAELVNYMEKLVKSKLEDVLNMRKDICHCEQCKLDIMAVALNNLTPRYIVTDRGKLYTRLDMMEVQFGVDILMAISKGIKVVTEHPRHQVPIE